MVKLSQIYYQNSDIINLIKNNVADLTGANPRDLKVNLQIGRNHVAATVVRFDKKDLIIENEK